MIRLPQPLRDRKLIQWSLAYLAAAWATLQMLQFFSETYGWSPVLVRVAPILLAGGLLVTLILAWYHGVPGRQSFSPLGMLLVFLVVIATTTVAFVVGHKPLSLAAADVTSKDSGRKSVAVLPFANLSDDKDNAYFASGIHDELLTQLAQLADLKVISRTSVLGYKDTQKPIRQIARELGVNTVLEGSVQRVGNRVRVQAQLVDARTDGHLWAQSYDRDLTDVFAIQSDIAQQIARALQAKLTKVEKAGLAKPPTQNAEAYDLYLRAREYQTRPANTKSNLTIAENLFERAIVLDPNFALAHAWLSFVHGWMFWGRWDRSAQRLEKQKREADSALRLDPNLPEGHFALGFHHYWGREDYTAAISEFQTAARAAPGNAEFLNALGAVYRRQGKFDEAIAATLKATKLDPRNARLHFDGLGVTYAMLRRYDDAFRALNRAADLAPDWYDPASYKARLYVRAYGQFDTLRATINALPTTEGSQNRVLDALLYYSWQRDYDAALRFAMQAPELMNSQNGYTPRSLLLGWSHQHRGDRARAREAFEKARTVLESAVRNMPDDHRVHTSLGYVYAGLGRRADAVREAQRVRELLPISRDAFWGPGVAQVSAEILAQAGENDQALALIQQLLHQPSHMTVYTLRLNPIYDPLRKDSRFQALVALKKP